VNNNDIISVIAMIDSIEDIDTIDKYGQNALFIATNNNYIELVKLLLNYNADPYLTDKDGHNSFDVSYHNEELNQLLIGKVF